MVRCLVGLLTLVVPCAALAQAPVSLHLDYDTYAAGVQVAKVEAGFNLTPRGYQMSLGYHTTGLAGMLFGGHQFDRVEGFWHGTQVMPRQFVSRGLWRGIDRIADIEYQFSTPQLRKLMPPIDGEREAVPDSLQVNSIDTLSALMQLIHIVADTGRCETRARTFDGWRAVEIEARSAGEEVLEPSGRSSFAGKALHCDFTGRMLAGFLLDDDRARDSKPLHGSAWLARMVPGAPPLPVRLSFQTRWFGDATMYLTAVGQGWDLKVARGD